LPRVFYLIFEHRLGRTFILSLLILLAAAAAAAAAVVVVVVVVVVVFATYPSSNGLP